MKRVTTSIFLLCFLLISCSSQKKVNTHNNSELPKEFFQRWKLDYGTANGEKINGLSKSPENDYEFRKDKTYILYSLSGNNMIGTWEYNKEDKCVYTRLQNGTLNGKIIDLKTNTITLVPAGKSITGTSFENYRFYYILNFRIN
ncbi:hypothetical protein [Pontimicrobium sp. SW4]|uniref:Lipocalin-like domain-containing protein n=1 Tax=Pontimicrobium sp. SW4 TaxID=3153519 RepID=A0AAU7BQ74_9FLAO